MKRLSEESEGILGVDYNNAAVRSGVGYVVSHLLITGIGFITTPFFSRVMSTNEYGELNNILSWENILVIFLTLSLEASLVSARYDYEKEFNGFIKSIIVFMTLVVVFWFAILMVFSTVANDLFGFSSKYMLLVVMDIFFGRLVLLYQQREKYYYRYKNSIRLSLSITIVSLLLSVGLVLVLDDKLFGRMIGIVIPTVIAGIFIFIHFIWNDLKIKKSYYKYALMVSLPYIPHLLSMTILNSTDRIMINKYCGSTDTALYSLAYNASMLITVFFMAINDAFVPWLGDKLKDEKYNDTQRVSIKLILLVVVVAVMIVLVTPEIILVLGGEKYADSIYVMPPVVFGCTLQYIYTLFVNVEQLKKKTGKMAIASMGAAVINVVLNIIFIPMFGYIAAAYTTLASYFCLLIFHMCILKVINYSDVYNNRMILWIALLLVGLSFAFEALYMNRIVRILVLLLVLSYETFFLITHKKMIKELLGMIINKKYGEES